ncbi:hypothetical protein BC628DRAFT_97751 [Trametes gibbosa]|nr:hypothetical protein BC628DRAFT_97751 [Trametes gibbosa]
MSDLGFNIWGVVTGAIGLLSLLPAAWIYSQFPSRKLRVLELIMDDTVALFSKGLEAGLHTHKDDLHVFSSSIWVIDQRIDDMRSKVIALSTWRAQLRGWWDGVSGDIDRLHNNVNWLRAQLSASSSRDRRRLAAEGHTHHIAEVLAARSRERLLSVTLPFAREDASMHFDAKSDVDGEHQDTTKSYLAQDHQMHALPPLPWNDIWRKIRRDDPKQRLRPSSRT